MLYVSIYFYSISAVSLNQETILCNVSNIIMFEKYFCCDSTGEGI